MIKYTKIFSITKTVKTKKSIVLFVVSIENLGTLKYRTFSWKYYFFLLLAASVRMKMKRYLKWKNQLRY